MSAAAVIIVRRKRLVRRFAELGAICPDRAVAFADIGVRRSWIFDQMVSRGVFVHVGSDRYYMNEPVAVAFIIAQRRRARILGGTLLLLFLIFLLASTFW